MEQVLNENCEMLKDMSDEDVCVITKAWLKGDLEYCTRRLEWLIGKGTHLYSSGIYRTKKKTIKIGDMEVPEPFKGTLKDGVDVYCPDIVEENLYFQGIWENAKYLESNTFQENLRTRGLIHLDKDSAITHAKALIKVSGGEV